MLKANTISGNFKVGTPTVRGSMQVNVGGGGGGTTDYEKLKNKPSIENVELIGNKNFEDLGLEKMSNMEILTMFNEVFN